jgi:outer membrane protein OmpA-like peptidoglycan-associated protein
MGSINEIVIDKTNKKWIATDNGVFALTSFESEAELVSDNGRAVCIATDKTGSVWAAFDNGELVNMETGVKISMDKENIEIRDIQLIKSKLWVGTNQGLYLYNTRNQFLSKDFTERNSKLKSNVINFIFRDIYDIVWVGTESGVSRFKDEKSKKPLNSKENFKIIAEENEFIWMITDVDMHLIFDGNRWQGIGLKNDIHTGEINDLAIDQKGNLYIASDKLVKVDPEKNIIESYSDDLGLLSKKCLSLAADAFNHIYIGTAEAGLFRLRFSKTALEDISATCFLEKPISCHGANDAELKVYASGGTPPYRYKWDTSGLRGDNPKGLKPGTYNVTVTDRNKAEFGIEITFTEPNPIEIQLVESSRVTGPNKSDGALSVEAMGGKPGFTYEWNTGRKGQTLKKVKSKEYSVTATDSAGCTAVNSFEVPREKYLPDLAIDKIKVGQTLKINHLYFESDSSDVTEVSFEVLDELYDFLSTNQNVAIEIGGHTNNIPSHEYCDNLSSARAENVAQYLYVKGIHQDRIGHKGYGKRNPIATNESLAGRRKNQRVEIKILSIL